MDLLGACWAFSLVVVGHKSKSLITGSTECSMYCYFNNASTDIVSEHIDSSRLLTTSATACSASLLVLPLSRLELGDTWRILIEHLGFSGFGVRVERAVARDEAGARSLAA